MANSMIVEIQNRLDGICEKVVSLMNDYYSMTPVNASDSSVIGLCGDHTWDELPPEGKKLQTELIEKYDELVELITFIKQKLPGTAKSDLQQSLKNIDKAIKMDEKILWESPEDAIEEVKESKSRITSILEDHFGPYTTEGNIAIPDTNVIIYKPDIEEWKFENIDHFTLILTPTVLSELDSLKTNHRNEDVREKSKKVIRKIREYRRRGSLNEGVPIVKGKIDLRSFATEPDMEECFSWFDPTNEDDRFLATSLEIIRKNLSAQVFVVTRDINMQNKADFASIPYRQFS